MVETHYIPTDDYVEHEPEEDCVCGPRVKLRNEDMLVIHRPLNKDIQVGCGWCVGGKANVEIHRPQMEEDE